MRRRQLTWQVGYHEHQHEEPTRWVAATVPGAPQLDWATAQAQDYGDYWYGDNYKRFSWMEDLFWTYRAPLCAEDLDRETGEQLFLVGEGVDYRFHVLINNTLLHQQEGMYTPFTFDLTDLARPGDELRILVFPPPKSRPRPANRQQADHCVKPAISYGDDFHPRLIPCGLWGDAYLEARPYCYVRTAAVDYRLSDDYRLVEVWIDVELSRPLPAAAELNWTLLDQGGSLCISEKVTAGGPQMRLTGILSNPRLWWPHDQGEPVTYESRLELWTIGAPRAVQRLNSRVGFRRLRLVMHEGAWEIPADNDFPKTRSNPPATIEINGRRIFCKGSNCVPLDIFHGKPDDLAYRALARLAKSANMNLLRLSGGGLVFKESFYDECDRLGLLVWQDFPLSCNLYPDEDPYLAVLDQESRSIIHRLRGHPCLAIWCAGNELFNVWSGMTEQSFPVRLLNRNCYDLDRHRPFVTTSPLMGMGHGYYAFCTEEGKEGFTFTQEARGTAYLEFGCPGPAAVDQLKSFIPPDQLFPPRPGTSWQTHGGFRAWDGRPTSWLYQEVAERYFGPSNSLEELVEKGQLLQSEGLKAIFEEARRQKPVCSIACNWCLNEPWPTVANLSLVSWPLVPKPAFHAVAASCRPVLASARVRRYAWRSTETFAAEIWLLSDSPEGLPPGQVHVGLTVGPVVTDLLTWHYPSVAPNTNCRGPIAQLILPAANANRMTLNLRVANHPEYDSSYTFSYRAEPPYRPPVYTPRAVDSD